MTLSERFDQYDDEFLEFKRIKNPLSARPDLCAFLILDVFFPGKRDIISGAEHDEIYLEIDCEKFDAVVTDTVLRDLVRCGIRYDKGVDSLCMYV